MPTFLIESSHDPTPKACLRSLEAALNQGSHYFANAHWGCDDGVHKSWVFVEAADRNDVGLMVPPADRDSTTITLVKKFTPEEVRARHAELLPVDP